MILSIISAMAQDNRVIGVANKLPWHLPEDLKHFKAITAGHHIIMGRLTYESIGKLLPGRVTVIVSRNKDYSVQGCITAPSLEDAIKIIPETEIEAFVIGGAQLYNEAIKLADKIYLTEITFSESSKLFGASVTGDAFFPDIDLNIWKKTKPGRRNKAKPKPTSTKSPAPTTGAYYRFVEYERTTRMTWSSLHS